MNEDTLKVQVLEILKHDSEIVELLVERLERTVLFKELREFRDEVNKRFETMQEQMDRRFEAMQKQMDQRFEAMQKQMDQRFEAMQKQMDQRFEAMQKQMDQRFEAMQKQMDQRFEAMQKQMDRRFEIVDKRLDAMMEQLNKTQDWIGIMVGGFQVRAGRNLEDAIAGTLSLALRMKDIKPENIRMRQKFVDHGGLIGPAGRQYEYDMLVSDHETIVFEIKSSLDTESVERFSDKAELAARVLGLAQVRKVIVSLEKRPEVAARCRELDIELV